MKIGVLIDKVRVGGVEKFAFEEVKRLKRLGHNTELLVLKCEDGETPIKEVQTRNMLLKAPLIFKHSFNFPIFHFFASHHVLAPFFAPQAVPSDLEVIISHGTYTCFTALSLWKRRKIPYIAYIHDPISYILPRVYSKSPLGQFLPILTHLGRYLDELITKDAILRVTQSKFHMKFLQDITSEDVKVVYPGCYPDRRVLDKRGDYILAIKSMWTEDKKAHILLDILDSIDSDASLIIVGRWDLASYEKFTREVKNRKLDSRVSLTGEINEEKLANLYRRARVMVHVMTEAFGMTGLEAASHGCPFIIPEGSGVTEIFNHDVHGFFPKEGEFDRYVEYVNKLISDERLAWKMGYEAWKVSKEYTWGNHTKKLVEATEAAITARN